VVDKKDFSGLELKERLAMAGLASDFAAAVSGQDESGMTEILIQAGYSEDATRAMVQTLLQNPDAYKS
jgi:hypothetical protein